MADSMPPPAAASPADASGSDDAPKSRLMIKTMVLENFKSYAGRKVIGPFHKCFSAIVGPNGSGKSNVIDAMLFVFGKRAKKLRLNKVGELIHNSADHPGCEFARVTVFFHDIIDTSEGDNGYTVIPNSELQVSRTAYTNNKSEYHVDGKKVTFTQVGALLRTRGVDLDNNRFLILQGEVEQISLMKPRALTPHEDGLLEYLEDIIGSKRYVEAIEKATEQVEVLAVDRSEKLNRVKIVEKEKDGLEDAKSEAEALLAKEMELLQLRNRHCQVNLADAADKRAKIVEAQENLTEKLEHEQEKNKDVTGRLATTEEECREANEGYETIAEQCDRANERFNSFQRRDIKYQEDIKHIKKQIETSKDKQKAEERKSVKLEKEAKKLEEDSIPAIKQTIEETDAKQTIEQEKLDKVFESLQGDAEKLRKKMQEKQAALAPLSQVTATCQGQVDVTTTEIQLVEEAVTAALADQAKLQKTSADLKERSRELPEAIDALKQELKTSESAVVSAKEEIEECVTKEESLTKKLRSGRARLELAKETVKSSKGQSRLVKEMLSATAPGQPLEHAGLAGRLGDLGYIPAEYDVAVSTACGSLDNLVVENTKGAESCIKYLREKNLGRTTCIIMERQRALEQNMNNKPTTPENVPRLFDLIQPIDPKNAVAFYFSLRDTLVAKDLDQAVRIAYRGSKVAWRVVTLKGELVDKSGTMSGGGKSTRKGQMNVLSAGGSARMAAATSSSTSSGPVDVVVDTQALGVDVERLSEELGNVRQQKSQLEQQVRMLGKRIDQLQSEIPKLEMELGGLSRKQNTTQERLQALKKEGKTSLSAQEQKELAALQKQLKKSQTELDQAKQQSEEQQAQVDAMQSEIEALGGDELKKQKKKAENATKAFDEANTALNKAMASSKANVRNCAKAKQAAERAGTEFEKFTEKLETVMEEFKEIEDEALVVMQAHEAAKAELKEQKQKLEVLKKEHEEIKAIKKNVAKALVEIENQMDDYANQLKELSKQENTFKRRSDSVAARFKEVAADMAMANHVDDDDEEQVTPAADQQGDGDEENVDGVSGKKKATESGGGASAARQSDDSDDTAVDGGDAGGGDADMEVDEKRNDQDDEEEEEENEEVVLASLPILTIEQLDEARNSLNEIKTKIAVLEEETDQMRATVNLSAIAEYKKRQKEYRARVKELDIATLARDDARAECETLRKKRLDEFMAGFSIITLKLKEMYQMITLGGDAELELVDTLDPFSEGIVFSVRPPKKSWKNISNLSGGEKTLSSLALVFALHHYKPTPLYVMDEIDAALDYKNVSIVANYIKERTKNAQFIIISLRNNMFELADRLVGIYKTHNATKSVTVNPALIVEQARKVQATQVSQSQKRMEGGRFKGVKEAGNEEEEERAPLSDVGNVDDRTE